MRSRNRSASRSLRRGRAEELVELDETPLRGDHSKKSPRLPGAPAGARRATRNPGSSARKRAARRTRSGSSRKTPGRGGASRLAVEIVERARARARTRRAGSVERERVHGEVAPEEVGVGVRPSPPRRRSRRARNGTLRIRRGGAPIGDDARAGPRRQAPRERVGASRGGARRDRGRRPSRPRNASRTAPPTTRTRSAGRARRPPPRDVGAPEQGAEPTPDRGDRLQRRGLVARRGAAGHATHFTFEPSASGYAVSSTLHGVGEAPRDGEPELAAAARRPDVVEEVSRPLGGERRAAVHDPDHGAVAFARRDERRTGSSDAGCGPEGVVDEVREEALDLLAVAADAGEPLRDVHAAAAGRA